MHTTQQIIEAHEWHCRATNCRSETFAFRIVVHLFHWCASAAVTMSALSDTLSTLVRQLSMCELELSKLDSQLQSEFAQRAAQVCASNLINCCSSSNTDAAESQKALRRFIISMHHLHIACAGTQPIHAAGEAAQNAKAPPISTLWASIWVVCKRFHQNIRDRSYSLRVQAAAGSAAGMRYVLAREAGANLCAIDISVPRKGPVHDPWSILASALKHAGDADQHARVAMVAIKRSCLTAVAPDDGPQQAAVEELEQQVQLAAGQLSMVQQRTGVPVVKSCWQVVTGDSGCSMGTAVGQQQLLSDLVSHLLLAQVLGWRCMSRMLTLQCALEMNASVCCLCLNSNVPTLQRILVQSKCWCHGRAQEGEAAHTSALSACEATLKQQRMLGATSSSALALEELDECVWCDSSRGLMVPSTHCIVTTLTPLQTMSTAYDRASTPRDDCATTISSRSADDQAAGAAVHLGAAREGSCTRAVAWSAGGTGALHMLVCQQTSLADRAHILPTRYQAAHMLRQVFLFCSLSDSPFIFSCIQPPPALRQVHAAAAQLEEQGSEPPNMPPPHELSDSICCLLVRMAGRPCSLLPELELADVDFAAASSRPGVLITSLLRSDDLCTVSSTICTGIDRGADINTPYLVMLSCSVCGRPSAAFILESHIACCRVCTGWCFGGGWDERWCQQRLFHWYPVTLEQQQRWRNGSLCRQWQWTRCHSNESCRQGAPCLAGCRNWVVSLWLPV